MSRKNPQIQEKCDVCHVILGRSIAVCDYCSNALCESCRLWKKELNSYVCKKGCKKTKKA